METPKAVRKSIQMTPAETTAYLANGRSCALATLDQHGFPHVVAMNYAMDGDDVVMTSFGKAQKVLNLRRDPRVTVMVDSGSAYRDLKGVMVRGRAEIVEGAEKVLTVMRLLVAKAARIGGGSPVGQDGEISSTYRRQAEKRVVIRIHPEKYSSWDHTRIS